MAPPAFISDNSKTAVIACEMSREELLRVIRREGVAYPVFWVQPALHNDPKKLHDHLQALMDSHSAEYDRYLLALGQCGGACERLTAGDYTIIVPRVDDCITTLLGSIERRRAISREKATYFLTQSWLGTDSGNLLSGYEYTVHKYGPQRGKRIYSALLKNYRRLGLLDTGCYDLDALKARVSGFAEEFHLTVEPLPATDDYLRDLLLGPWDEQRFCVACPGSTLLITLF